jgi:hypothetical protein
MLPLASHTTPFVKFVTLDAKLARSVKGIVATASIDALR